MQRAFGIYPASAAIIKPTTDGGIAITVADGGVVYDNIWGVDHVGKVTVSPATDNAGIPVAQPTNPATGQPMTGVPGYVSELAGLLTGTYSTDPQKNKGTESTVSDGRPWLPLQMENGKHYILAYGVKYKLMVPTFPTAVQLHISIPPEVESGRISFGGKPTGRIHGSVATRRGESDGPFGAPMMNEQEIGSYTFDFKDERKVSISALFDGGDNEILLGMT